MGIFNHVDFKFGMGAWDKRKSTIIGIIEIEDIEVGVVEDGGESFQLHFGGEIGVGESFGVEGGFGDIEEGIEEGPFARMLASQNYEGCIMKFPVGLRLMKELIPHILLYILQ